MYYIYKRLVDSSYDLLESLTVQVIKLFLVFAEVKKIFDILSCDYHDSRTNLVE